MTTCSKPSPHHKLGTVKQPLLSPLTQHTSNPGLAVMECFLMILLLLLNSIDTLNGHPIYSIHLGCHKQSLPALYHSWLLPGIGGVAGRLFKPFNSVPPRSIGTLAFHHSKQSVTVNPRNTSLIRVYLKCSQEDRNRAPEGPSRTGQQSTLESRSNRIDHTTSQGNSAGTSPYLSVFTASSYSNSSRYPYPKVATRIVFTARANITRMPKYFH
jgi:hypothetical protein